MSIVNKTVPYRFDRLVPTYLFRKHFSLCVTQNWKKIWWWEFGISSYDTIFSIISHLLSFKNKSSICDILVLPKRCDCCPRSGVHYQGGKHIFNFLLSMQKHFIKPLTLEWLYLSVTLILSLTVVVPKQIIRWKPFTLVNISRNPNMLYLLFLGPPQVIINYLGV